MSEIIKIYEDKPSEAAIKKVQHILNKINETSTERSDSAGDYGTQASDTEDGGTGKQDSTESET